MVVQKGGRVAARACVQCLASVLHVLIRSASTRPA
jgi:hypothetical protein